MRGFGNFRVAANHLSIDIRPRVHIYSSVLISRDTSVCLAFGTSMSPAPGQKEIQCEKLEFFGNCLAVDACV